MKQILKTFLFEASQAPETKQLATDLLRGYLAIYEAPHAAVHDAKGREVLIDAFSEFDGDVVDGATYKWIKYIGDMLSGKPVKDFYGQEFHFDETDTDQIIKELSTHEWFVNQMRRDVAPETINFLPEKAKDELDIHL